MQRLKTNLLLGLAAALFVAAFFPAFVSIAGKWSTSEDYSHAFFTVPIILYMFWIKRDVLAQGRGNGFLGLLCVVGSLLLYLLSLQLQVPTIIYLATALTIIAMLVYLAGFGAVLQLAIPIALLLLIIPIPNQILSTVTASLQLKVSQASTLIVQMFSIPILREGNILHIPEKTFQVVEACSGIRSLISMATLSLILGFFSLTRKRSVLLLLLFSLPVAVFINIVRVVAMVLSYRFFQIDLVEGAAHTITGLGLFLLGLGLQIAFQRVLEKWETRKASALLS